MCIVLIIIERRSDLLMVMIDCVVIGDSERKNKSCECRSVVYNFIYLKVTPIIIPVDVDVDV